MTSKGATEKSELVELTPIGTVDEATHRVVSDHWQRYDEGGVVTEQRDVWRTMNVVERMALVMRDVEHVGKSGQNREQNYSFRPIDEFMNSLHTPLVRHEVVVTPRVVQRDSFERDRRNRGGEIIGVMRVVELLVEFTFHAPDGSTLVAVTAGEGADVADKATNKAMAGALKYAIMQTFMVPTRELTDGDLDTPEVPSGSRQQQQQHAGDDAAVDAIVAAANELGRDAIMHELNVACETLGQTRAQVTKKWRDAHDVGAATNLDDETKVPTVELFKFVAQLRPYVQQARERQAAEQQPGSSSASSEPATEEPPAQLERSTYGVCDARDGEKVCTAAAGHDGDHVWWG